MIAGATTFVVLWNRGSGRPVTMEEARGFAEAVFQDGDVAGAVEDVTADGALYFSAAGNGGRSAR